MLKILSARQTKAVDAYTIAHEPVSSLQLMERACMAFASWFVARYATEKKIAVICGTGNNGGDGAGIARILTEWGYDVQTWVVGGGKETEDFAANCDRLIRSGGSLTMIDDKAEVPLLADRNIIIDALFGSGLSRPAGGIFSDMIEAINAADATTISVDVPSGLFADRSSEGSIVKADHTVTFQLPKLAFMFPENATYVGEWHLVEIRLSKAAIGEQETTHYYITQKSVRKLLHPPKKFANKGSNGKALLIAGSYGKMGACVLASRAALRSGVGLLVLHVPEKGYNIVQTAVPEAMATVDADASVFTEAPLTDGYAAIGIGPGIGKDDRTRRALEGVLEAGKPMVIDADALNMMGEHRTLLKLIPPGSILTPHPKEFERLTQKWSNDFERLDLQTKLARETNSVVIVKGAHTSIASPAGKVCFNATGNPGMAKGGSGDVLTGILTGLLAQGYGAEDAAVIGVYLHGLAGDAGAAEKGENSLTASDLVDFLPAAYKKTRG